MFCLEIQQRTTQTKQISRSSRSGDVIHVAHVHTDPPAPFTRMLAAVHAHKNPYTSSQEVSCKISYVPEVSAHARIHTRARIHTDTCKDAYGNSWELECTCVRMRTFSEEFNARRVSARTRPRVHKNPYTFTNQTELHKQMCCFINKGGSPSTRCVITERVIFLPGHQSVILH